MPGINSLIMPSALWHYLEFLPGVYPVTNALTLSIYYYIDTIHILKRENRILCLQNYFLLVYILYHKKSMSLSSYIAIMYYNNYCSLQMVNLTIF